MSRYELTVVLPGKSTPAKKKTSRESVEKIIKTLKGKIERADDWGEIGFSYPIAKNNTGNFLHFNLELNAESAKTIVEKLRLEEGIIRYLLVKKE